MCFECEKTFITDTELKTAPEDPHWRETLQVFTLRQEIQSVRTSEITREDSHWRETLSLFCMREEFQSIIFSTET